MTIPPGQGQVSCFLHVPQPSPGPTQEAAEKGCQEPEGQAGLHNAQPQSDSGQGPLSVSRGRSLIPEDLHRLG